MHGRIISHSITDVLAPIEEVDNQMFISIILDSATSSSPYHSNARFQSCVGVRLSYSVFYLHMGKMCFVLMWLYNQEVWIYLVYMPIVSELLHRQRGNRMIARLSVQ